MDFDHMNDAEFMAWFEREFPPDENGNRTRYRDTMVMDLMRAAYRAGRVVPAQASGPEVDDLAMLVARLVRALRKAAPDNELSEQALDYLKREGLTGSALRAAPVPAQGEPVTCHQVADVLYGFGNVTWEMAYEAADAVLELFGESK